MIYYIPPVSWAAIIVYYWRRRKMMKLTDDYLDEAETNVKVIAGNVVVFVIVTAIQIVLSIQKILA